MIVYLPYAYRMTCVPPGCVATQGFNVFGTAPFEVPDVGSASAPVSCEFEGDRYRSFEGRSYRALGMSLETLQERLKDCDPANDEWWSTTVGLKRVMGHLFEGPYAPVRSPFELPREEAKVAELVREAKRGRAVKDRSDDGNVQRPIAAAGWARSLLIVDGEPWMAAAEPRYMLEHHDRAIVLKAGTCPTDGAKFSLGFRADRRDEAVAYGRALAASVRGRYFREDVYRDVEIASPSHLTYDEAEGIAKTIHDGPFYGLLPYDPKGETVLTDQEVSRRRALGDRSWVHELLSVPDLRERVGNRGYACSLTAREREVAVKACQVALDAWDHIKTARPLAPSEIQEEDYVLSM